MRHIVILPPHGNWAPWRGLPSEAEPDREKTYRLLAPRGFSFVRLNPFGWPWNPFAKSHPLLGGIDPLRAFRVLLFHRRANIVLCFFESSALVILLLRRLLGFSGKVVLFDVGLPGSWRLRDAILRRVLPRADMLMVLGHAQVAGLVAAGAPAGRVVSIRTCSYPDFFVAAPDKPGGYVLAIGDDISRDYLTLLQASSTLPQEVVIRSRKIAEDRLAYPNVRIVSDALSEISYRDLIAGALLVVVPLHPSVHAGGVSTLLEAMATGKAVVVTRSDGLADYVEDGKTCRLVPPGDAAALGAAIAALAEDAGERQVLGAGARRFIVECCSPESVASRLDALWKQLPAGSAHDV